MTLETTERVPASFSAARMAFGHAPRAFAITSVKLPLPSKRDMMLKGDRSLEMCLGKARAVKRCRSWGQISCFCEDRLKIIPVT